MGLFPDDVWIIAILIIAVAVLFLFRKKHKQCVDPVWRVKEVFFFNHQIKIKGGLIMTQAKVDQKFHVSWPSPVDKYGNAATVQDGSVKFSSDDEEIATVEPNPDGGPYSCTVTTQKKTGATAVRIKADADLDQSPDAEKIIEGQMAVEVVAGDATGFGEPTADQPVDNLDTPE